MYVRLILSMNIEQLDSNLEIWKLVTWGVYQYEAFDDSSISESYFVTVENQDWKSVCLPDVINE